MKKIWPLIFILFITCVTFYKVFTKAEFPYPGDLLVSFNFPWYSGGWDGYDPWTTHKEFVAMDAVRQHLPWHKITFTSLRDHFSIPLWNPYSFSGGPHLGNIQSYIFNPINFLFVILPMFPAWIIFIILQVPLTIFFTYLFARSLKLSNAASLLAGISFLFSSYYLNWLEIGIVGYSILWLPLILLSIQKLFESPKSKYQALLIFASCATIFAGHIQTAVFVFLMSTSFFALKIVSVKKNQKIKYLIIFLLWGGFTFLLTAVQTLPALETYLNSPLTEPLAKRAFDTNSVPFFNFISLFAQDFFGNPSSNNFWSVIYGDGTPYVGSATLFFAVYAFLISRKKEVKYFAMWTLVIFMYTTRSPFYLLIQKLNVPFLTGTTPAREMFVLCFSVSLLGAFGMDEFILNKDKKRFAYILMVIFGVLYALLMATTFVIPKISHNAELSTNLLISRRNIVVPAILFLSLPISYIFSQITNQLRFAKLKNTWVVVVLTLTIFAGSYQFNKGSPSSPREFFFPEHPVFSWIKENGGINRFQGEETAKTWNNISAFFGVYSAEGYQVFRDRRYAELFASQETGKIPSYYERSVAEFTDNNINNKKRLYNLTGVKYLLAKDDSGNPSEDQNHNHNKPNDNVKLIWQSGKFKIYEREDTLPRYWLTTKYVVVNNDQEIFDKIYDSSYDLKSLLLEEKPNIQISQSVPGSVELLNYGPDEVKFKIEVKSNQLIFLSDTYNKGWNAYVDGQKTKILRAHYVFRAVEIPSGSSVLEFKYEPIAFKYGLRLTILGLILISPTLWYSKRYLK